MRAPGRILALLIACLAVAACGTTTTGGQTVTFPPGSIGPDRTVTPAVLLTRAALVDALGQQHLVLQDTQSPFRPPEAAILAGAPRAVYQVILPEDLDQGYIVVYELRDPPLALQAAQEQAAYLATGPGRVNFPLGAVHVIRQVGSSVVLYSWNPGGAKDPSTPNVQVALETVGLGVPVPN